MSSIESGIHHEVEPQPKNIIFAFPGQGSQYEGMGRALVAVSESARKVYEEADKTLGRVFDGYTISELCLDAPEHILGSTENTQPAIFTTSVAMLETVKEYLGDRIKPAFLIGHSLGEYTALVGAGVLKFNEALFLVYNRGLFMKEAGEEHPGKMVAILGDRRTEEITIRACRDIDTEEEPVSTANFNALTQTVISGDPEAVDKVAAQLLAQGVKRVVPVSVSIAAHSVLMEKAVGKLERIMRPHPFLDPNYPLFLNATAQISRTGDEIKRLLPSQLTSPVHWRQSLEAAISYGASCVLELGPKKVLTGLAGKVDSRLKAFSFDDMLTQWNERGSISLPKDLSYA